MLIPLIIGICIGRYFFNIEIMLSLIIAGVIILALCHTRVLHSKYWFGGAFAAIIIAAGMALTSHCISSINYEWPKEETLYAGYIYDKPIKKNKSNCATVFIRYDYNESTQKTTAVNRRILLYYSPKIQAKIGDEIYFFGKITPPHNNGNPDEFDYASYLFNEKISGISFTFNDQFKISSHARHLSIIQTASVIRDKLLSYYNRLNISTDDRSVLEAITLGYKTDLSDNIKNQYAISGVSHLLSLAGLHIGFIYAILLFLLKPLDMTPGGKKIRPLVIIALLWMFAFITGLLPPVLRTVIMFSIVSIGQLFNVRTVNLNTLAVTAFIMLLFYPLNLFNVSFQLSFIAVAGIIIGMNLWLSWWNPQNSIVSYLWNISGVSLSAQIATLPLLIYYFHSLSIYFIITNILAIFLASFVIYTAAAYLLCFFLPPVQNFIGEILSLILHLLNAFTKFICGLPYSSVNSLYPNLMQTLIIGALIVLIFLFITKRTMPRAVLITAGITTLFISNAYADYNKKKQQQIIFYNNYNSTAIQFIMPDGINYLYLNGESKAQFTKTSKDFIACHNLYQPLILCNGMHTGFISDNNNIINFGNISIGLANDKRWSYKASRSPLHVDYMVIAKGYHGKIVYLTGLFSIKHIILDGSLSDKKAEILSNECNSLKIDCIDIKKTGAYFDNILIE